MRSIMPFVQPRPPEAAIGAGLIGVGWGAYSGAWLLLALGVACLGIGVYDLWRARRPSE